MCLWERKKKKHWCASWQNNGTDIFKDMLLSVKTVQSWMSVKPGVRILTKACPTS